MKYKVNRQNLLYVFLILVLAICLWVGWSDYEFVKADVTQQEIRDSIRHYIRWTVQITIQFVLPIWIVSYFVKKIIAK